MVADEDERMEKKGEREGLGWWGTKNRMLQREKKKGHEKGILSLCLGQIKSCIMGEV